MEKLLLKPRILRQRFQPLERLKVRNPRRPHSLRKQLRQAGVGLQQPPALGDAVGFVVETFRPELEEIWYQGSLHQFGVQS